MYRMSWLVLRRPCIESMCQSSLVNANSQNETKFEIKFLLKHYWKLDYTAAAVTRRTCEVEGGVVSERVAQRWLQSFNAGEENAKDLPRSGRAKLWDIENIRRVLEENPQKVLVGRQKNLVHLKTPYITRLRHLENHTETVDLYPMN